MAWSPTSPSSTAFYLRARRRRANRLHTLLVWRVRTKSCNKELRGETRQEIGLANEPHPALTSSVLSSCLSLLTGAWVINTQLAVIKLEGACDRGDATWIICIPLEGHERPLATHTHALHEL
mmetsp:Transcript_13683/g.22707  ORF Transcript_13683/g.22707 Transcript_13683/m.22707 type:complete len:122 (+) Transcript_13683:309-674(+)